ncbi:MAG TPA: tRNA (guanosine(37)-N1)-methyltransferase TrmD [Firmicutes bacterium]|nr:tRNA (guanosine(37)-N1)-methyltransferase TrmD [Bacillota bacterium]
MRIDILTLFPEMFDGVFNDSILKRAQERKAVSLNTVNFRDFSENKHKKVDDYPYGGGAGMLLAPQPIFDAVESISIDPDKKPRVILMCPQGERFSQAKAEELAREEHLVFICGHYEGYDERIREHLVTDELSIGDYVLTGGELAAMVMTDAVVRLLPDVLGKQASHEDDSFSTGLLEYPQYTRPVDFRGMTVPPVLTSGNHKEIEKWRREQSLYRTFTRRPDLLEQADLSAADQAVIEQLKAESK